MQTESLKTKDPKRFTKLLAVLITFAMLLAACGSSSDGDDVASGNDDDVEVTDDDAMDDDAMDDDAMDDDAMMGAFGPGCASVPADGEGSFAGMADDPAGTAASNNPLLSTLVTAVVEADLVDTLNSDGPFTVFAPTNDAFAAVPEDILAAVLADKDLLTSVLTYHVIGGESLSADDLAGNTFATVEGGDVALAANGEGVNDATVLCSNVPVANGTVHIIDSVLLPQVALDAIAAMTEGDAMEDDAMDDESAMMGAFGPGCASVPADGEGSFAGMADDPAGTAASNNPLLSTLVTAVVEADLVDTLNSDGPFTIFAPTNDAFAAVPEDILAAVLADKDLLTSVLTYHVIGGESLSADDLAGNTFATVEGGDVALAANGEGVNDATVLCSNVPVANGTVHIIDSVLLPQVALDAIAAMTEGDAMSDGESAAFGPGCAAVPADGEGSFAGMADDPAGTAASNNPLLSTLVTAVVEADLVDTLNSDGPFTIFAPTNDAFGAIPEDQLAGVLADQDLLTSILTLHVVAGESLSAEDLLSAETVTTVNGGDLTITAGDDGLITVNGAAMTICQNVPTANATVHIIDAVLLP